MTETALAVPADVVIARLSDAGHGRGLLMETALGTALRSRVRYVYRTRFLGHKFGLRGLA